MLTKLDIILHYESSEKISYQISSTMHGILMEKISPEYGEILHQNGWKPFHQYISHITEDSFQWTICAVNQEAKEQVLDVLMSQNSFELKHKKLILTVVEKHLYAGKTYDSLIEEYYFQKQPRNISIEFLTPCAFKQEGKYTFMPDVKLIFQSLMNKYDSYSTDSSIYDSDVLEHFENYVSISQYNLRSVRFYLEGVKIPAFMGRISLHINGPEQLVNLANMLIHFGEYSGIGIKSALGMGAINIVRRDSWKTKS